MASTLLLTEGLGNGTFVGSPTRVTLEGLFAAPLALPDASFYYLLLNQTPDGSTALNTEGTVVLKNTAGQYFYAYAYTASTSEPLEGDTANISATISKDGGAQTAVSGTIAEVSGGLYRVLASQAETNANEIVPLWTSATGGVVVIPVPAVIYTTLSSNGAPATGTGTLADIVIGDDYTVNNGREFAWDFVPPDDMTVGGGSCKFGASVGCSAAWLVTGTLSDIGGGEFRATFDLTASDTVSLGAGFYKYSVEVVNDSLEETTIETGTVRLVSKQT